MTSTLTRLETVALTEGWSVRQKTPALLKLTRYDQEITIAFGGSGGVQWIALFEDGQPVARYGLGDPHRNPDVRKAQGGGELINHVRGKAQIAEGWLRS